MSYQPNDPYQRGEFIVIERRERSYVIGATDNAERTRFDLWQITSISRDGREIRKAIQWRNGTSDTGTYPAHGDNAYPIASYDLRNRRAHRGRMPRRAGRVSPTVRDSRSARGVTRARQGRAFPNQPSRRNPTNELPTHKHT